MQVVYKILCQDNIRCLDVIPGLPVPLLLTHLRLHAMLHK
jgi:hypothetical protein